MPCPACHADNPAGVLTCASCGTDLYDAFLDRIATKQLTRTHTRQLSLDPQTPPSSHPLVLYLPEQDISLGVDRESGILIGRVDEESVSDIDLDLGPYHAQSKGVSRVHLRLDAHLQKPHAIDLDSYNGSFINGEKLVPQLPYALNSGDELRLGRFSMRMYFKTTGD